MTNHTNSSILDEDGYPPILITCERINGSVILLENIIVGLCLLTHRAKFRKKEYWLQLVCLNINDIFSGLLMLLISYLRYTLKNKPTLCSILWSIMLINEMTFLYNVLGVCLYRLLFLRHSGQCRFGWKTKTTIVQVIISVLISSMYTGTMFGLLVDTNIQIADCSIEELFRNNKKTSGITVTAGFVFPLLCTDILYSILLYKIHLILKRRQSYIGKANMDSKNSCGTKSLNLDSYKFSSSKKAEGSYSKRGGIIHKQSPQEKQAAFEDEEINLECINVDNDNDDLHSDDINQLDLYDNDLNKQLHKDYTEDDNVSFPNLDLTSCIKETEKSKKTSTQDENSSGTQNKMARNSEKLRQVNKNSRKTLAGSSTRHGYRSAYTSEEIRRIKRQDNAQLLIYGGKSNDNQKQSINLIGVVLFMINLSIFIPLIVSSTANFNSSFKISKMTRQILVLIVMNNALFDPWAYAFQSREFRHALVENMGQLLSIVRK